MLEDRLRRKAEALVADCDDHLARQLSAHGAALPLLAPLAVTLRIDAQREAGAASDLPLVLNLALRR